MIKKAGILSVLCVLFAALSVWGLDFKPGKYEIALSMEMPGMPGGMPPQTITQCLSEQDPVPVSSPDAQECKLTNMKTQGNTVTYMIECRQQGMEVKNTGEITYKGDSFEGTTKMSMGAEADAMTVITVIKGKRIGKCD